MSFKESLTCKHFVRNSYVLIALLLSLINIVVVFIYCFHPSVNIHLTDNIGKNSNYVFELPTKPFPLAPWVIFYNNGNAQRVLLNGEEIEDVKDVDINTEKVSFFKSLNLLYLLQPKDKVYHSEINEVEIVFHLSVKIFNVFFLSIVTISIWSIFIVNIAYKFILKNNDAAGSVDLDPITHKIANRTFFYNKVIIAFFLGVWFLFVINFLIKWSKAEELIWLPWDSITYLQTSLPVHMGFDGARTIGYPLFLNLLFLIGDIRLVPVVQFFLLLCAILCLVLSWFFVFHREILEKTPVHTVSLLGIATIMLGCLLYYQPLVSHTYAILPEILYIFLSSFLVLLLIVILADKLGDKLILYASSLAIYISIYIYYVKPHWGVSMIFTLFVIFFNLALKRNIKWYLRLLVPAFTIILFIVTVGYPQYLRRQSFPVKFGPITLFCNNADIIAPVLERGNDFDKKILESLETTLSNKPPWKILGFNGDECLRSNVSKLVYDRYESEGSYTLQELNRKQSSYYNSLLARGILNDPSGYLKRIIRQLYAALSNPFPSIAHADTVPDNHYLNFKDKLPPLFLEDADNLFKGTTPKLYTNGHVQELFQGKVLPLLNSLSIKILVAISIVLGFELGLLFKKKGYTSLIVFWRNYKYLIVAVLLYISSLMVVAISHTFDIIRYLFGVASLALFVQALGLSYLLNKSIDLVSFLYNLRVKK